MRTIPCRHRTSTFGCPHCRLFDAPVSAYKRLWSRDSGPQRLPLPCHHLGADTGVLEDCGTCKGHVRRKVFACAHPAHVTTTLKGCETCPDYSPAASVIPAGMLVIPRPPALSLTPQSRRAVVTVCVGEEAQACLSASGPSMRAYAASLGADFVVLDWPGHPDWPMSAKYAVARTLDHYERILYADADVLFRPGCVDLFGLCGDGEMGVVDELPHQRVNPRFRREEAYQRFRLEMGFRSVPHIPFMFNAGVVVVPASHQAILMPPTQPIRPTHCSEQDHVNARLLDSGVPYRLMDRRANWQDWTDHGFRSAPREAVLHWSGSGGERSKRAEDIAAWARRYPWPG